MQPRMFNQRLGIFVQLVSTVRYRSSPEQDILKPPFWRDRFGAAVLAQDDLAQRRFVAAVLAPPFWRDRFGAVHLLKILLMR